jgi:hypothetical protein
MLSPILGVGWNRKFTNEFLSTVYQKTQKPCTTIGNQLYLSLNPEIIHRTWEPHLKAINLNKQFDRGD